MPDRVEKADVLVVGGGIVGLATAWQLQNSGVRRVIVAEKEPEVARHQTGRNSGVLHSGIYYRPGSLKAETCRRGKQAMEDFCQREDVAFERCGKVVVAKNAAELPALNQIEQRSLANGAKVQRIGPERLREIEPYAQGLQALWVPETGIVDFIGVCHALARRIRAAGGEVRCNTTVITARPLREKMLVESGRGHIEARVVVACAGLQSDRVAQRLGIEPNVKIVPFRGEYHLLGDRGRELVKGLIYPVPDPRFPFLGVHFTRRIDGSVDCGPNAVLAIGREAYTGDDTNLEDLIETLCYPGFLRLARKYLGYGMGEIYRSVYKQAFAKALQELVPSVSAHDLRPAASGIRAQAVTPEGDLLSDFLIEERKGVVSVLNAPSPAATASLEIGRIVAQRTIAQLPFAPAPSSGLHETKAVPVR